MDSSFIENLFSQAEMNNIEMQETENSIDQEINKILESISIKHIILDCSSFNFTDSMGVDAILQVCHSNNTYLVR
jgi:hypothetical protein